MLFVLLCLGALPAQSALEAAMREAVAASCPGRAVAIDPDLTRACRAYVRTAGAGQAPVSGSAVSFYASLESSEPAPVAGVATVSPPSNADRAVGELFPRSCRFDRMGVAAGVLPSKEGVVCALTAAHGTDLDPLPGRVEPGAALEVSGKLAPGLSLPRLFVTRPTGEVEELKLGVTDAGRFAGKISLRDKGEHSVEVLADGSGGPQVVALRRIFAGVNPPFTPPPEQRAGEGLAGVEAAIARLRASRGLHALQRDPELDAVAEGHSKEMALLKTFAHVLPTDGSLTDRLRKKGYAYRSAGENIGLSDDAASAHEAIVGSPAHLSTLLDPRYRRLGLGKILGPTADGEGVYLTEVLATPIEGSADPAGDVARLLFEERKKRGLPELTRDVTMDGLAAHEARAVALADSPVLKLQGDAAAQAMDQVAELRSAVAELFVGSVAEDVVSSKNIAEPRWTRLGVGALYASSKQYGPGRLWVVLLYGR